MQTSVLVQTGPATQTLGAISDSVSKLHNYGWAYCGSYTNTITSVPISASTALSTTELYFGGMIINLQTSLSSKVGTHNATVALGLSTYTTTPKTYLSFTVTI